MSKCHVGDVASGRVFSPPDQTPPKDVNKRIFASQSKSHARSDSMSILPEGRGREGDAILFNTMVSRSGFGEKAKKPCACALPSVDWLVHRRPLLRLLHLSCNVTRATWSSSVGPLQGNAAAAAATNCAREGGREGGSSPKYNILGRGSLPSGIGGTILPLRPREQTLPQVRKE